MRGRDPRDLVRGWRRLIFWKRLQPAAEMVLLLLDAGQGWAENRHHLTHQRCQVSMWTANRWYGFELAIDGRPAAVGGRKVPLDRWSRGCLIAGVKRYLAGHRGSSDEIAALAHRVTREFTEQVGRAA